MSATDYDFTSSRNEVIESALSKVGALAEGETATAEMMAKGVKGLNEIVKRWQNEKLFIWSLTSLQVTLSANTPNYSLETDPAIIGIDRAYIVDSSGHDQPIEVISWRDYNDIQDKAEENEPTSITVDVRSGNLYVWPTPDKTYTLKYLGIAKLKDWDSASASGDIPERFISALTYALAADLADDYGLNLAERGYLKNRAEVLFREARRGDRDRQDKHFVDGAY